MKNFIAVWIIFTIVLVGLANAQETGTFTDSRDGHVYEWVKIGDQIWMAENMANLPEVNRVDDSQFEGKCYYVYGYDGTNISEAMTITNYKKYGVLYNWDAARENCPDGWHLPTDEEWAELEKYLGMNTDEISQRGWRASGNVGEKIKSVSGWKNGIGTNKTGFNVFPGGCRGYHGFGSLGYCAYFWTASPAGGDNGWRRGFCGDDKGSNREEERRYFGISVRCVKDFP